jgi:hypothetical protein
MKTFHEYVWLRMPVETLVVEVSELFPKRGIQELFDREVQRLRRETWDEQALRHIDEFAEIDVIAYIDSSLRRAGFHQNELDSLVNDLAVKLLLGGFFRGWQGQSLVGRFKISVKNAINSLRSRAAKKRVRQHDLPDDVAATRSADSSLIDEFRNFVATRFGAHVVRVLDHRLEDDGDTKDLVGTSQGLESSYKVKLAVSQLKRAIGMFAADDPKLAGRIERLVAQERRTFDRRFGRMSGVAGQR